MKCPECGGKTGVRDTRHFPDNETYRLRRCAECGHTFFTTEFAVELTASLLQDWMNHPRNRFVRMKGRTNE